MEPSSLIALIVETTLESSQSLGTKNTSISPPCSSITQISTSTSIVIPGTPYIARGASTVPKLESESLCKLPSSQIPGVESGNSEKAKRIAPTPRNK
ncbi:MAG: hypothetical protein CXT69_01615 [Methanobacteriota archaeon]|nr:MAG: hypothetical protein CXT69_01615 [Euryarchaeota archaeon]